MDAYTIGEDFSSKDYTENFLPRGEYEDCNFDNCVFANSDVSGSTFAKCRFSNCDLSMVKLRKTTFHEVEFKDCKLQGLHFDDCNDFLISFDFEGCILNFSIFHQLKLKNTRFKSCKLVEVDFTATDLSNAVFNDCDLSGATFDNTILESADLRKAWNFEIDPTRNRLAKAKFSQENVLGLLGRFGVVVE